MLRYQLLWTDNIHTYRQTAFGHLEPPSGYLDQDRVSYTNFTVVGCHSWTVQLSGYCTGPPSTKCHQVSGERREETIREQRETEL